VLKVQWEIFCQISFVRQFKAELKSHGLKFKCVFAIIFESVSRPSPQGDGPNAPIFYFSEHRLMEINYCKNSNLKTKFAFKICHQTIRSQNNFL